MENKFKLYLVSRLLNIIGNFPMYTQKRFTDLPFSVEGITLATNTGDSSFINTPGNFLKEKLGLDFERDEKAVAIATEARGLIVSAKTSEELKEACKKCLEFSDRIYPY